ncbi:PP2C family protein-serine/threonine phosphatase [Carboxylicivirga linearis]|uniref:Response regulator n=1 Tax=Carboxylicivirga linearis TaxID=1628157 RepID=A0ABS5JVM4_9BACT|nr:response regulator [Carboxylicivirga linearis]MBS2098878.1 response regulator [Carboxylicivirga linearis]
MINTKPTILLVDDSQVNLEILKDSLSKYITISALNGDTAIELALSREKPDLILLDIIMPGMDGFEVCKILKSNEVTRDIPVIFITGQNDMDSIIKGFESGAVDFITKPFNILELKARVKTQVAIKMARDQNKRLIQKIGAINKKLTDSIEYAKKIQTASLPKKSELDRLLPEYFVMLKPRDIVSGDFYWVSEVRGKVIIVAADCTGHGVPGAIMSMFGVAYLHEIINDKGETEPAKILDRLREIVIQSLQQDEKSEIKDGMDISIVTIDKEKNELQFAGAFNPIILIRNDFLNIYPADHMPVAYGEVDRSFRNHTINYQNGDCLYMYSDGYASQFGGPNDKKLMQKGFRQLIMDHHNLPMDEQKIQFENFLTTWKGSTDQIDDILLIGIRL